MAVLQQVYTVEQLQQYQAAAEEAEDGEVQMKRFNNTLPIWGNKETMNINHLILSNIRGSPYFKTDLFKLKTYHEVIDEIYYKVGHLEPWEKNSRKTAGQIGMCAGVRGVSAGGIVSTSFCILYKLFTLKLTRKQVTGMLNHSDSPYIRGLGFLYIRYCQPPLDFNDWFEPYFDDEEEVDLKAGGGYMTTVGEMAKMMVTKLDWFGTLFPRMPVSVQKMFMEKFKAQKLAQQEQLVQEREMETAFGEAEKRLNDEKTDSPSARSHPVSRDGSRERRPHRSRSGSRERRRNRSRERESRDGRKYREPERRRSRERRRDRSRSRDRQQRDRSRERRRSRSRERRSHRQHSRSPRR